MQRLGPAASGRLRRPGRAARRAEGLARRRPWHPMILTDFVTGIRAGGHYISKTVTGVYLGWQLSGVPLTAALRAAGWHYGSRADSASPGAR
jgi:hypothetical protein